MDAIIIAVGTGGVMRTAGTGRQPMDTMGMSGADAGGTIVMTAIGIEPGMRDIAIGTILGVITIPGDTMRALYAVGALPRRSPG